MAHLPEVRFDPVDPATANATRRFNFLRGKGVFNVFLISFRTFITTVVKL